MPIKDKEKVREYKKHWIARKRQGLKKPPVEPCRTQYYQANSIKVLISLKEYLNLSKDKFKLWYNFNLTFQDLQEYGVHDIIQIMKLREDADILINDYWKTAKHEEKQGNQHWNSLTDEQQHRLINYWAKEKLRKENNLLTELEKHEQQAKSYEKEIELAKFHEERGKIRCACYACSAKKELQKVKAKELFGTDEQDKEQCPECGKYVKWLAEEHGLCRQCLQNYEE